MMGERRAKKDAAEAAHLLSRRQLGVMTFPSTKEVLQPLLVGRLEREVVNHPYALGS
jgi:hypothetical protein